MTEQPSRRHKMHDIAVLACAGTGVGIGTGLMTGAPFYTMTVMEDRAYNRQGTPSDNVDVIAIGALGVIVGGYVFVKSARWLCNHTYR